MSSLVVLLLCSAGSLVNGKIQGSCKEIQQNDPTSPSGVYHIQAAPSKIIEVYCEMGLNGGGYTFLDPQSLTEITDANLQSLITDRSSLLMRIRRCDGTQPYIVLEQLPQFANSPISFTLNSFAGYQGPVNLPLLGTPYLFAGFLPQSIAATNTVQGIKANGVDHVFDNCDANGNSQMTLFPNFGEKAPTGYAFDTDFPFCNGLFDGALPNPSTRVMVVEYFMFAEFHFGGCGCYSQTDQRLRNKCILGFHIGFR